MTYVTYTDILRPSAKRYAWFYDLALVVGGSLFIALSARITIPLPFSPVPLTGQTLAVLLIGALLGSRRGGLCLLAYLVEGIAGLPVFAGGAFGLAHLLGPTGGYLMGFIAAAYITGLLAERGWDRRTGTTFLAMLLGNAVVYACGLPWLASFTGVGRALLLGFYPFIAEDLLKSALAAVLLPSGWSLLGLKAGRYDR
ncbi:MAG TPA: biotin transporter BioY [Chloroflexi bacterium]|nr:biotin transporter BioY [Chloroflexota bacterium]